MGADGDEKIDFGAFVEEMEAEVAAGADREMVFPFAG